MRSATSAEPAGALAPAGSADVADRIFHGVVPRLQDVGPCGIVAALCVDALLQLDEEQVLVGAFAQRPFEARTLAAERGLARLGRDHGRAFRSLSGRQRAV